MNQGRHETAAAAYGTALERQPYNWLLMSEVSKFLTHTLKDPQGGLEMAEAGLSLNPACSSDLWNDRGESLFQLDRIDEAHDAYERALEVNPDDVRTRFNLIWVFSRQKDFASALKTIAEALSLDRANVYRERLLQQQTEILSQLDHRYSHEKSLQLNRVGNYVAKPKTSKAVDS